jgi:HSP20 family protein
MNMLLARRSWDPWREIERIQQDLNQAFALRGGQRSQDYPLMNAWTDTEGATLVAELPGINAKTLEITVLGENLTVKSKREEGEVPKDVTYHRRERAHGSFARTITLPFRVEAGKVVAEYKRGVLKIMAPRAAEDRPKAITVKTA